MGVREIDRCLEKWRMEVKDTADDPGADAQGAGEVVRRAAAGPGLDGSGHRRLWKGTHTLLADGRRPSAREGLQP